MYQHISPYELTDNPFRLIAKEWMLITAKKPDDGTINTMTASWGGCGIQSRSRLSSSVRSGIPLNSFTQIRC